MVGALRVGREGPFCVGVVIEEAVVVAEDVVFLLLEKKPVVAVVPGGEVVEGTELVLDRESQLNGPLRGAGAGVAAAVVVSLAGTGGGFDEDDDDPHGKENLEATVGGGVRVVFGGPD